MGLFDRWGRSAQPAGPADADEQAIARYRYLVRTAPPETIEAAHAEAFARLTPEQRRRLLAEIGEATPQAERAGVLGAGDEPGALARAATRAEMREPGVMERIFGAQRVPGTAAAGPGLGGTVAGSLLGSLAGTVLGSLVAQQFLSHRAPPGLFDSAQSGLGAGDAPAIDNPWTTGGVDRADEVAAADDPSAGDAGEFDGGGFDDGGIDV